MGGRDEEEKEEEEREHPPINNKRCISGMGWEVGERVKRERTYVYLWLIRVDVSQKPT